MSFEYNLPKQGLIFIDNSIFAGPPNQSLANDGLEKECLKNKKESLRVIANKLYRSDNWLTIQEVIEEFQYLEPIIDRQKKYIRTTMATKVCKSNSNRIQQKHSQFMNNSGNRERYKTMKTLVNHLSSERKRILRLFNQEFRNASLNLTDELETKINTYLPIVETIFSKLEQTPNEKNTDCKLIATTMAFGDSEPIYLCSEDKGLLITYSLATRFFPEISNPKITNFKFIDISCNNYLRYHRINPHNFS
jgi:hypothetical protein